MDVSLVLPAQSGTNFAHEFADLVTNEGLEGRIESGASYMSSYQDSVTDASLHIGAKKISTCFSYPFEQLLTLAYALFQILCWPQGQGALSATPVLEPETDWNI